MALFTNNEMLFFCSALIGGESYWRYNTKYTYFFHYSWLKQIRRSVDNGVQSDDFLGTFRVPLKDIPATGLDTWFDLYEDKRSKIKVQGQCHLRLELAFKQGSFTDQLDCAESEQCSLEDFHSVVTQIYKHAVTQTTKQVPVPYSLSIIK